MFDCTSKLCTYILKIYRKYNCPSCVTVILSENGQKRVHAFMRKYKFYIVKWWVWCWNYTYWMFLFVDCISLLICTIIWYLWSLFCNIYTVDFCFTCFFFLTNRNIHTWRVDKGAYVKILKLSLSICFVFFSAYIYFFIVLVFLVSDHLFPAFSLLSIATALILQGLV